MAKNLTYAAHGLTFTITNATYINVSFADDTGAPFTCIGVYDYAAGESTVNTHAELVKAADEWYAENADEMHKHLENHIG